MNCGIITNEDKSKSPGTSDTPASLQSKFSRIQTVDMVATPTFVRDLLQNVGVRRMWDAGSLDLSLNLRFTWACQSDRRSHVG